MTHRRPVPARPPDPRVGEVLDRLAASGMRRTSARQAILEAFFAAETHVTAEDIALEVHRRFPSVESIDWSTSRSATV